MKDRTIKIAITVEMEVKVDSRVSAKHISWVARNQFDTSDGRKRFSVEMIEVGAHKAITDMASCMQDALVTEMNDRFPRTNSYVVKGKKMGYGDYADVSCKRREKLARLIGEPEVGYRVVTKVRVDGSEVIDSDW